MMARNATYDRYKYMLFMYTAMWQANQTGSTFFDPLFFHYPSLQGAYQDIEHTFMVGNAIKVSPLMQTTHNFTNLTYTSFFPPGNWTDLDEYTTVNV